MFNRFRSTVKCFSLQQRDSIIYLFVFAECLGFSFLCKCLCDYKSRGFPTKHNPTKTILRTGRSWKNNTNNYQWLANKNSGSPTIAPRNSRATCVCLCSVTKAMDTLRYMLGGYIVCDEMHISLAPHTTAWKYIIISFPSYPSKNWMVKACPHCTSPSWNPRILGDLILHLPCQFLLFLLVSMVIYNPQTEGGSNFHKPPNFGKDFPAALLTMISLNQGTVAITMDIPERKPAKVPGVSWPK